ncbi:alpha-1,3/alpha-1,6-mannosyltransferase [Fistulifera solaris]|uniref:Alpha-1,3/1,6-mannosyltransferase ALG2 n=1 Tax=Fistulifera solaris TaxID=1519565 RepID=A0A1Z5J6Z0_FISSO|nr:alpha-1,3/alpha-1,6-mannosyltransferase [Fistulifera solaris]|eukprot:GAX09672.1 alpha-1,3/alpha-1,6-mannosyltransferase [Fistulifera solaris]
MNKAAHTDDTTCFTRARPLHVVLVHVDLGIGGAEQLILQLAQASKRAGHTLDIVTTRCDPDHCFAAVKPGGDLFPHLQVVGRWIPATLLHGKAKALCSTLRLAYLAWWTARKRSKADVYVLDVLPLPLWIWNWISSASLLFYCHFPDLLLLRRNPSSLLQQCYRRVMDGMEEHCMKYADLIAVNSQFTRETVRKTFSSLQDTELHVLYPALDTASLEKNEIMQEEEEEEKEDGRPMIVSLNRFERKKNLELVLEAAAWYQSNVPQASLPRIVIAGGYDLHCTENVEYLKELQQYAAAKNIPVIFMKSISDATRASLLKRATAVMYTPTNEHFGIVPLEVMYSETIVIAVNAGGPKETIVDGVCGYLCEPTEEAFGRALQTVLEATPEQRAAMGRAAKERVIEFFSEERLMREWQDLLSKAVCVGRSRQSKLWWSPKTTLQIIQALSTLVLYYCLTRVLTIVSWWSWSSDHVNNEL